MTYTVKNGTWCKDNEQEYFSCTKVGMLAALKAGEITSGTKVVVHDRRYEAGQIVQSLNPNPPEGFFVPDGASFDVTTYTELAEIFPDGHLPDLRECVLVMSGKNTHLEIVNHDVFTAGQFKDDCLEAHAHGMLHTHEMEHTHDMEHTHNMEHTHTRGTMNITGRFAYQDGFGYRNQAQGAFYRDEYYRDNVDSGNSPDSWASGTGFDASRSWEGETSEPNKTSTGQSSKVTTGSSTISETSESSITDTGDTGDTVTRTKQYGVYYYIAF